MPRIRLLTAVAIAAVAFTVAACGSGSSKSSSSSATKTSASEAASAATGDIPDNQAFLTFTNSAAHYSIRYPEGWAQSGSGGDVSFKDKDNVIHVVVARGAAPTVASVKSDVAKLAGVTAKAPTTVTLKNGTAIKVSYSKLGAPNPVTGKRANLVVDRYVYAKGGRVATVDLGTAKGVDNVDAYKMISSSFRWR